MAGARQPIELLIAKGKKHLTIAEIEKRKQEEVKACNGAISPPKYLTAKQKKEFNKIADELIKIEIMTNLDCDALARYIIANDNYIKYCKILKSIPDDWELISAIDKATSVQDRAFKQCQSAAKELGLTIGSRCKLTIPKTEEKEESDPMAQLLGRKRA